MAYDCAICGCVIGIAVEAIENMNIFHISGAINCCHTKRTTPKSHNLIFFFM